MNTLGYLNSREYPFCMKHRIGVVGVLVFAILSLCLPANSITFGREVTNGSETYPSVVSIWYSEDAEDDASFICTGTLIEARIVLTAAHCVLSTGLYFVQYGADQLFDEMDLLPVSATWRNPRYSASQMVNDTGLLLLENEIDGAQTTKLPSSSEIKKLLATKGVKYEIVGWGKDQNDEPASYLRKAAVDDQTTYMKKFKGWRNDVWLAVGKWNSKEKVFAGSCNGDSGGPLFATAGSKKIIVGITSWGAEDCETRAPSVYVRLSYYVNSLVEIGIPALYTNEVKQNRAMPRLISEPKVIGEPKVSSSLTCDEGEWSSNTQKIETKWSTNAGWTFTDASNPRLNIGDSVAADTVLTCTVTASNSVGTVQRTASVTLVGKPTYSGYLSISGIDSYSQPKPNTEVVCSGITWFKNPESTSYKWFVEGISTPLSSNSKLQMTTELIRAHSGKRLTCVSAAVNNGGKTEASVSLTLPTLKKPSEPSISITYFNSYGQISAGTVLDCVASPSSYGTSFDSVSYRWGYGKKTGNSSTPDGYLTNGKSLTLDANTLALVSDKSLYCYATVSNIAGEVTYVATRDVAVQTPPVPITKVTSTTLSFSSGINSIKVGDVITCGVSVSGSTVSRVRFVWRNSNIPADVSYSGAGGFREVTFIDQQTTQTSIQLSVTPSVLSNIQGLYLDCLAYVDFTAGPSASGYTKVSIPAASAPIVSPTPTPTPTPTLTPADSAAPRISEGALSTSRAPAGTSFVASFSLSDNIGVTTIEARLMNPSSVAVQTSTPSRVSGTVQNGTYSVTLQTPLSAINGEGFNVQIRATDAAGNFSDWVGVGTFTVANPPDTLNPNIEDGSSEMVSGWSGNLGQTPVLSLIAVDNVGVTSVVVSLYVNDTQVNTSQAVLYSGSRTKGVWRATLNFSGSEFVGNWQIRAVATDSAGNQSTQRLLREVPVAKP